MIIAIDIGNSNIVLAAFIKDKMAHQWRIRTDIRKTSDEYKVLILSLLTAEGVRPEDLKDGIISSVVPDLNQTFLTVFSSLLPNMPLILSEPLYSRLPVHVLPQGVGSDLVCNALYATQKFNTGVVIVDFGTALSFTSVSQEKELLGVTIAPGLKIALKALSDLTAQLPHVELKEPEDGVIGINTVHSIQAGMIYGYSGLVESIISRIKKEMGGEVTVLATGGLSTLLSPLRNLFDYQSPQITLKGLYMAYQHLAK